MFGKKKGLPQEGGKKKKKGGEARPGTGGKDLARREGHLLGKGDRGLNHHSRKKTDLLSSLQEGVTPPPGPLKKKKDRLNSVCGGQKKKGEGVKVSPSTNIMAG